MTIGDSSGQTALINNEAGATWTITDTSGLLQGTGAGSHFYNAGLFQKTLGSGFAMINADFISVGTIASAGGGDIEFDGATSRLSGTYIGAGMVDYGPDGVATIGNVQVTQASCQSNFGVVRLVGVMTMYDGSTIMNAQGASWDFAGDSSLVLAAGQSAGPDINGMGTIAKTAGTGTSVVSIDVEAEGAVVVNTGTLDFDGAAATFSGPISGAGVFELDSAAAMIAQGAALSVADWTLAGGVTTLGESLTYAGAFRGRGGRDARARRTDPGVGARGEFGGIDDERRRIRALAGGGRGFRPRDRRRLDAHRHWLGDAERRRRNRWRCDRDRRGAIAHRRRRRLGYRRHERHRSRRPRRDDRDRRHADECGPV